MKAIDAHTVGRTTTRPDAVLPYGLAQIQILPAKVATTATTDMFNQGKGVVGAGPYRFVSYQQGDLLVLERNPNYWGPKPKWDKVTFRFIPDDAARVAALLGGDLDLVDFVPPNFIDRIKSNPRTDVATGPSDRVIYLIMDQERDASPFVTDKSGQRLTKNPLKDRRVREALSLSVDRKTLTDRVMDGAAIPAGQMTIEGFGGYNSALKAAMPFDLASAKQLLSDAGYSDGFGIGLNCTNDRYVNDAKVCQALGQMFARAGLKVDVQTMPRSVFFPKATDHAGERFSLLLLGWGNATSGDAGTLPSADYLLRQAPCCAWRRYRSADDAVWRRHGFRRAFRATRHRRLPRAAEPRRVQLTYLRMAERLREVLDDDPRLANAVAPRAGITPLFCLPDDEDAAVAMATLLLAHGADPNVVSKDGLTAEQDARRRGLIDAADLMSGREKV